MMKDFILVTFIKGMVNFQTSDYFYFMKPVLPVKQVIRVGSYGLSHSPDEGSNSYLYFYSKVELSATQW
jgi:hypothetical protein